MHRSTEELVALTVFTNAPTDAEFDRVLTAISATIVTDDEILALAIERQEREEKIEVGVYPLGYGDDE